MLRLNKKGFALVETLIVSVIVMTLFTILYTNFYPMMGEYNRRENYDDVDSIYNTNLIRSFLEISKYDGYDFTNIKNNIDSDGTNKIFHASFDEEANSLKKDSTYCQNLAKDEKLIEYCQNLFFETKVVNLYLTEYNLSTIKKNIENNKDMDSYTKDYIGTLSYYSKKENNNGYNYRIIVEYAKEINKESTKSRKEVYGFSTMGVDL